MRIVRVLVLIAAVLASAASATPKPGPEPPPPSNGSYASSTPGGVGELKEDFDKFKNRHTVKLHGMTVATSRQTYLDMGVVVAIEDDLAMVILVSVSEDWQYLRCHSLAFLADGKLIEPTEVDDDGDVGSGVVSEVIMGVMPKAVLAQLLAASKVEGKICNDEFTLSDAQVTRLHYFAAKAGLGPAVEDVPEVVPEPSPPEPETPNPGAF